MGKFFYLTDIYVYVTMKSILIRNIKINPVKWRLNNYGK